MNLYKSLLFLHGHVADPSLAQSLADSDAGPGPDAEVAPRAPAPRLRQPSLPLFSSFWLLGGLDDIDPRIGEDEAAFGPSYGNKLASARWFGTPAPTLDTGCVAGGCG